MLRKFFDSIRKSKKPLGDYDNWDGVLRDWSEEPELAEGKDLIFSVYETPDYEGYATVIFYDRKAKKYYEVYGSHCSCYGLENQFVAEEIVFEELEKRLYNDSFQAGFPTLRKAYEDFVATRKSKKE